MNDRSFSQTRGADLDTTDNNLVILAAARNNEVAWDTSKGGALTYNFEQCLGGGATDTDHSGSISMQELTACVQARLDKTQEEAARQHATLAGNAALVPAFVDSSPSGAGAPAAADPLATLNEIYNQRDDRWQVAGEPRAADAQDRHQPRAVDPLAARRIRLHVLSGHPTRQLLSAVSESTRFEQCDCGEPGAAAAAPGLERDGARASRHRSCDGDGHRDPAGLLGLALPAEYVSAAGPFEKIRPTAQAVAHISQIATLSAAAGKAACQSTGDKRDLGVARQCSNVFGASLVSVEETD